LAALFKRGDKVPWDVVVIDEASMFRNKAAKRWKHVVRLTWGQPTDVIELTGTPSPNGLHQVWAQIAVLDGGQRLEPTYKKFLFRYFKQEFMGRKV
ncbi:UNVERIFIED_CONTAM: ATP-dependent helicase, partial [Salmonella enterica subsp. enterica serovar Weltevreden]